MNLRRDHATSDDGAVDEEYDKQPLSTRLAAWPPCVVCGHQAGGGWRWAKRGVAGLLPGPAFG
jgi:hypothetical protein